MSRKKTNLFKVKKREWFSYIALFFAQPIVHFCVRFGIGATTVNILSLVAAFAAAWVLIDGSISAYWAAFFAFMHIVLDKADGNIARLTTGVSVFGDWMDWWIGFVSNALILLIIGYVSQSFDVMFWAALGTSSLLFAQLMMFGIRTKLGDDASETVGTGPITTLKYAYGFSLLAPVMAISIFLGDLSYTAYFYGLTGPLYAAALLFFQYFAVKDK